MSNVHYIRSVSDSGEPVDLTIDDTRRTQGQDAAGQRPLLLILSTDPSLIDTVRKAAPPGAPVTHAPSLDHVADKLSAMRPGVLLFDTAGNPDAEPTLVQLTQHFPELVVVVAGKREDSAALMKLTAAGRIFRFLLKPLSHGHTRLALEASCVRHQEMQAANQRLSAAGGDGERRNYVVTYGALGIGLLAVIGTIWFAVGRWVLAPEPAPLAAVPPPGVLPAKPDPVQAELALAKEAFEQGRLLEPPGESALDLYRSALDLAPQSEAARSGIRSVADRILERAEAALTAERLDDAVRNIEMARDIEADHPRLAFLDTQIARERERLKLTQERSVGQRVRTLVAQANERMRNDRLISPAGESARDALLEARRLDPTDPRVVLAMRELAGSLTTQARRSIAAGRIAEAQTLVDAARRLGSAGADLTAVERALVDASRATATPVSGGSSVRTAAGAPPPDPSSKPATDGATATIAAARESPSMVARDAPPQPVPAPHAEPAASAEEAVLQAAELPRTRQVAAEYPYQARMDGTEGWVDIEFTISPQGVPEDLVVREARPRRVFDRAALVSVRQWRFEPIVRNGLPVARRATLRVRFQLQ